MNHRIRKAQVTTRMLMKSLNIMKIQTMRLVRNRKLGMANRKWRQNRMTLTQDWPL